jgi:hypothetical protein
MAFNCRALVEEWEREGKKRLNDEEWTKMMKKKKKTGSVRRDFKFGASNYIVSVPLKRKKKK